MNFHTTELERVLLIEPEVYSDLRGYFLETYSQKTFAKAGITERFVQDNESHSRKGVLRGMHFQLENAQGKLIRVLHGEIFDVAVDIRPASKSFGRWVGVRLSGAERKMIWIPKGFAHGFYTLSETADVAYKVTNFYDPGMERTLLWNDKDAGVRWPLEGEPILSEKDKAGLSLKELNQISRQI
ncbi:MAG TPA: dTDP-4-dehydrorhamnose 3,5-epimerase [Candidatus Acidoferrales bacterium]|nr:dTDP-4-dehydrorhamnose 3,5-epimerase [Candidatus Acidoferrales bacterium]